MELRHLRYFLAIASAESFTKASETLHVSQPSLSVQIRDLEVELGTRLLDRLGRKVMLTQAGELFRDHAQRAIRELEQATQLVQELHGAQRGRLVVGTLATVNFYLIAPLVSQFKQTVSGDSSASPLTTLGRHRYWPSRQSTRCGHLPPPRPAQPADHRPAF